MDGRRPPPLAQSTFDNMGAEASALRESLAMVEEEVRFTVNGKEVVVGKEVGPQTRLARYLRESLHLTGTKISCGQGGCGSCLVTAKVPDPATGMKKVRAVNSCLVPVLACNGWSVTTVEGVGSVKEGVSPIQTSLVRHAGSQCGFCTPGVVMAANTLLQAESSPSLGEVEKVMAGQLCRCTGYRPILDCVKELASCGEKGGCGRDIEDLGWECPSKVGKGSLVKNGSSSWVAPTSLNQALDILAGLSKDQTDLVVAGHTGVGVYPESSKESDLHLSISQVAELQEVSSSPVIIGAGLPISDVITALKAAAEAAPEEYGYCRQLAHHMELVGSRGIRDVGTIGGNLMLRHQVNAKVGQAVLTQMLLINSSILTFRRTWSPCSPP